VVALTQQLQKLENHTKDLFLQDLLLLLKLIFEIHTLKFFHSLYLRVVIVILVKRIHKKLIFLWLPACGPFCNPAGDLLPQTSYELF
jgi:hypothetical protein